MNHMFCNYYRKFDINFLMHSILKDIEKYISFRINLNCLNMISS